jgi:uncharacterized protein (TIGR03067 family)
MKALLSCGVVGFLVLVGGDADAVKKELKALAGTWKVESFEAADGKKAEFEGALLTFKDDNMEFTKDGETKKGTVKVNPAGKPKEIDIKPEDKNDPIPAIYQIDGATLKFCLAMGEANVARPNEFTAKDNWIVVVLKKEKQ